MPQVFDERECRLGEGPLWHPEREELFWVDIPAQTVMSAGRNGAREHRFDEMISALGWIDTGTLLLATETGLYRLKIDDWSRTPLCALEADNPETRSNDGRADPWGGFWIGTMGKSAAEGAGAVYRYYRGELRKLVPHITISNGICFDRNRRLAYYTDSATKKSWRFMLDEEGWPSGAAELFLDFTADGTTVDGAIVDRQGNLFCAIFDGASVLKIDPSGAIVDRFKTSTPRVTCPAFGGAGYSDLIVTTAAIGLEGEAENGIRHGNTLLFPDCVEGVPEPPVSVV